MNVIERLLFEEGYSFLLVCVILFFFIFVSTVFGGGRE